MNGECSYGIVRTRPMKRKDCACEQRLSSVPEQPGHRLDEFVGAPEGCLRVFLRDDLLLCVLGELSKLPEFSKHPPVPRGNGPSFTT